MGTEESLCPTCAAVQPVIDAARQWRAHYVPFRDAEVQYIADLIAVVDALAYAEADAEAHQTTLAMQPLQAQTAAMQADSPPEGPTQ